MSRDEPTVRRFETTGGATIERSERSSAEPVVAMQSFPAANERIRLQRAGEPEFVLREGVLYTANGIQVMVADQPDWVRNSVMTAALTIRRHEFVNAKLRAAGPATIEE